MKKTYCFLDGGGSLGLHTSLARADPARVVAIGRNPPKLRSFAMGVGDGDPPMPTRDPHHL